MSTRLNSHSVLILALVFVGSLSASSMVPMMGLFIVEGLEQQPWKISIYSAIVTVLTLVVNRVFGEWIDRGTNVSRLLLVSILCFLAGTISLSLFPSYMLLVTGGALFLGLSNAALSTTFTFGRLHAERAGLDVVVYNSWLRIHSSLGWMVGPALSFTVIGIWDFSTSLLMSAGIGCIWFFVWYFAVPRDFISPTKQKKVEAGSAGSDRLLIMAAASCLFFSITNSLYLSAMPLFFIQEAGLPYFAPGLSLTTKCLVEVPAIFSAAYLAKRWGERNVLYLSASMGVITFIAIAEVKTVPQMVLTAAFEGLYYGLFAGVAITFVQSFSGGRIGRATSMYMNSLFLGSTIGGVTMGLVASAFDYRAVIFFSASCALCGLVTLFLFRRSDAKRDTLVAETTQA